MSETEDKSLPTWGEMAKRIFHADGTILAAFVLVGLAQKLIDWLIGPEISEWVKASGLAWLIVVFGVWLVSGLIWLAGSLVAGFREPTV